MAIRKICILDDNQDNILKSVCNPITLDMYDSLPDIIKDMEDTITHIDCSGLAANQIGLNYRLIVFRLPAHKIPTGAKTSPIPFTHMINPIIKPIGDKKIMVWDRCLSIPGTFAEIERFNSISYKYTQLDGKVVKKEAHGFLANVIQHEIDHINGITIKDLHPKTLINNYSCVGMGQYAWTPEKFDGMVLSAVHC